MKKVIIFLLIVCMLFPTAGCSLLDKVSSVVKPVEAVFTVNSYALQLTADSTFQEKTGGSFDLQITNNSCYISIMAYQYIDLPEDVTPSSVYDTQNGDLFGKRDAVAVIEEPQTHSLPHGTMIQALHSAEKNGTKNYYATYLFDFPEEETFAWVLVTAAPSYFSNNRDYLHNTVCSLTPIK